MTRKISFGKLREYLQGLGFTESTESTHFRFDHPPSGAVVMLRRYQPGETVRELDLADVQKTIVENGIVDEASFEHFLQNAAVGDQDELEYFYRIYFAVCELGEALRGRRVTSSHSPWLPYDPDFHRIGALDDLMGYLHLTREPLEEWSKRLDLKNSSRQAKATIKKIAKAICPLVYAPGCDQARAKEAAFDLLGQAALDLEKEIEKKLKESGSGPLGDWASDRRKIWSS
jgi:hypothetical protein